MRTRTEIAEILELIRSKVHDVLGGDYTRIDKFGESPDYVITHRWEVGTLSPIAVYFRQVISYVELATIINPMGIAEQFIYKCKESEKDFLERR